MGTLADDLHRNSASTSFRCLACQAALSGDGDDVLRCPACHQSWPVRQGVPRFFEPSYYWGEVSKSEAGEFLKQAQEVGWRAAALNRFAGDRVMQISLIDWQRASWLPLLGLDENSVALDIGCGYGAITNSLARAAGKVFSLEAVSERIEFTRIRMSQEGISNVTLVQASALDPPFCDQMFDLVIVNGVLEWVGEWDHQGNPRDVQVGFLKQMGRILKPEGTLLIGIENRWGYTAAYGAIDHSGLPYTNFMPRSVATWWLRRSTRAHTHTVLNSKRQYRTYTYGAQGYRNLLADSGFPASSMYWPDPDYNQPSSLIPLESGLIADRVDTVLSEPTAPLRYGLVRATKRMLARSGALQFAVPSFVMLASKSAGRWDPGFWRLLRSRLPGLPGLRAPKFSLYSNPFGLKSVIRVFENGSIDPVCVIKTTTLAPGATSSLNREYQCMQIVSERFGARKDISFSVPRPLGFTRIGSFDYLAESVAPGLPVSRVVFPATGPKRVEILTKLLPRCVKAAIQITRDLAPEERVDRVDPSWLNPPEEVASDPNALAQLRGLLARCPADSVHHGDFTLENVFVDPSGGIAVIDWEHMFRGGSALHDIFTMFIAVILGEPQAGAAEGVPGLAQFEAAFFGSGRWASPFREWIQEACRSLNVPEKDVLPMLVQFLLLRFNQLKSRNSALAGQHGAYLAAALRNADRFLIGGRPD
jgi:ubiquinone/menaquinone biosynthesis C-methylase UbiE/uncharacterized protein YbaR (Trm112 family)